MASGCTRLRLVGLVHSDLLDLETFDVTVFALEDVNEAVTYAAANGGPFKMAWMSNCAGAAHSPTRAATSPRTRERPCH